MRGGRDYAIPSHEGAGEARNRDDGLPEIEPITYVSPEVCAYTKARGMQPQLHDGT